MSSRKRQRESRQNDSNPSASVEEYDSTGNHHAKKLKRTKDLSADQGSSHPEQEAQADGGPDKPSLSRDQQRKLDRQRKSEEKKNVKKTSQTPAEEHAKEQKATSKPKKATKASDANRVPVSNGQDEEAQPKGTDSTKSTKSQRFIAFIGNLPYSATTETITQHFAAIAPFSVRAPTDPKTGKPKGYAFLEFEGYDKMKSCLKLYHHSTFGEGKGARKINVELTAGGGGKGENRKAKIKEKNEKLKEERKKAHEEEAKGRRGVVKPARPPQDEDGADDENAGMHPSRRKRMGLQ